MPTHLCHMSGVKLSCDNRLAYRNLYQSFDHSVHHVLVAMASGVSKLRVSVNEQRLVAPQVSNRVMCPGYDITDTFITNQSF